VYIWDVDIIRNFIFIVTWRKYFLGKIIYVKSILNLLRTYVMLALIEWFLLQNRLR